MAAIDDLNTAVANLQASAAKAIPIITSGENNQIAGVDPAAVSAAATAITAVVASLNTAMTPAAPATAG